MADPAKVSVVIPAYNESDAIAGVIGVLRGAAPWHEIIVVDDGSSDGTGDHAAAAGATVVKLPYNMGNGAAVKNGIRRATGEYILIVDADGQHPPEDALRLVQKLGEYDLVVGARSAETQATQARRGGASSCTCCPTASRRRRRRRWRSSRAVTPSPSNRSTRGSAAASRRSGW